MAKREAAAATKPAAIINPFEKVSNVMRELNSHYGKELVRTGENIHSIHKVPFDEPTLDWVSDGGIPIGRITEFLGDTHSGKTRNALRAMRQFQKYCFNCHTPNALDIVWRTDRRNNPYVESCSCKNCAEPTPTIQVMIDIEGTTDPIFMKNFGIDINGVIYVRPDMPSQAIGIADTFLRMPNVGLILFDSIGSMGADKEVVTAIEDDKMNQNPLFFNKAMRKWQMALNSNTNETGKENGTSMIVVNQSYTTLGNYSTEVPQGGRGIRHGKGMSLKTRIREKSKEPNSNKVVGVHIDYRNEKNKTGMPYRRKEYYLNLNPDDPNIAYCHTNVTLQYVELALEMGIIEQKGAWFYYANEKYQGKANLIDGFDEDMRESVNKQLYGKK